MQVHFVPDRILFVRGDSVTYQAEPTDFQADAVTVGLTIPADYLDTPFMYDPTIGKEMIGQGGVHARADGNVDAVSETLLSLLTALLAAKFARDNPPLSLSEYKALKSSEIERAGIVRVEQDYPTHAQRRLALMDPADADRIACRDLILTVKAEVDRVLNLIGSQTSKTSVDTAFNSLSLPV